MTKEETTPLSAEEVLDRHILRMIEGSDDYYSLEEIKQMPEYKMQIMAMQEYAASQSPLTAASQSEQLSCGCRAEERTMITFTKDGDYCGGCGNLIPTTKPTQPSPQVEDRIVYEKVSVEDELPDEAGEYFVATTLTGHLDCFWDKEKQEWDGDLRGTADAPERVTHWLKPVNLSTITSIK